MMRLGIISNGLKGTSSSWQVKPFADHLLAKHSWNNIQDFFSTTEEATHSHKKNRNNSFHLDNSDSKYTID